MNILAPCLYLVLSCALGAQTAVLRVLMARDALDTATPATLMVIEAGGDRSLSQGFGSLLGSEDLKPLQVPLETYQLGSEVEQKLSVRLHLEPQPQWLLVARGDMVLAHGRSIPTSGAFAQELMSAGFHDRVKELQAYLKDHSESLEAHERLLALLRQRGERSAQHFMGIKVAAPMARLEQGDLAGYLRAADALPLADLSGATSLSPAQDLEAWSAFAQALDQAFRTGIWQELDLAFTREGRPLDAASPTLLALYQRSQPEVEAALRQDPGSEALWDLWVWMAQARGGGGLRALLASLTPSPLDSRGQWPPERAVRLLFATAHTPQEWRTLQALFQDRWDGAPHMLRERNQAGASPRDNTQSSNAALLEQDWTNTLEPLLESTLRCGEPAKADTLLREVLASCNWPALPAKAAAVANRCDQKNLAARWATLRPGGS